MTVFLSALFSYILHIYSTVCVIILLLLFSHLLRERTAIIVCAVKCKLTLILLQQVQLILAIGYLTNFATLVLAGVSCDPLS